MPLDRHHFDPVILREYDIRGIVGDNLHALDAYYLGRGFATFTQKQGGRKVCVGYDGRLTSPELRDHLIKGLMESGTEVIDIGLGPTPMLYFAVKHLKADAGIMITGSHNPSEYNGFKMTLKSAPVFGELIKSIGQIAAQGDFETREGRSEKLDIRDDYIERLLKDLEPLRSLKIAWDCGHGATGDIVKALTARLPGEHILLYEQIDGRFPAHHPDPTVDKNLQDLQRAVADHRCDLGIAFDGDGDRIGVVDEAGNILRCDILMTIYARDILKETPGATIIGDVKCSRVMFDEIERLGGKPVIWKTGHSLVKAKLAELNAPLAGELSGHIFFADKYYGFDDALYCAIRLMNAVARQNDGLSALTKDLPVVYNTPEIRIEVDESEKFDLVPRVIESLNKQDIPHLEINDIDGLRVTLPEGWWLLRPSNTQNALVARVESQTPHGLENLKTMLNREVIQLGYGLRFP